VGNPYPALNPAEGTYAIQISPEPATPTQPGSYDVATLNLSDGSIRTRFATPILSGGGGTQYTHFAYATCSPPIASFSSTLGALLQPSSFVFTGTGSAISWDFGDPTTTSDTATGDSVQYTFTEAGAYTITVIAENCGETDTATFLLNVGLYTTPPHTGGHSANLYANLSPNPGNNLAELTIRDINPGSLKMKIIGMDGVPIKDETMKIEDAESRHMLTVSGFKEGLYYIWLENNGEVVVKKLLIRH